MIFWWLFSIGFHISFIFTFWKRFIYFYLTFKWIICFHISFFIFSCTFFTLSFFTWSFTHDNIFVIYIYFSHDSLFTWMFMKKLFIFTWDFYTICFSHNLHTQFNLIFMFHIFKCDFFSRPVVSVSTYYLHVQCLGIMWKYTSTCFSYIWSNVISDICVQASSIISLIFSKEVA